MAVQDIVSDQGRQSTEIFWCSCQWRRQGGNWGGLVPPVVLKTNFEIFLNLKRKGGGGGGYDDSNF